MLKTNLEDDPEAINVFLSEKLAEVWERNRAKADRFRTILRKHVEASDVGWETVARRAGMSPEDLGRVLREPGYELTLGELDSILLAAEIDVSGLFAELELTEKEHEPSPSS